MPKGEEQPDYMRYVDHGEAGGSQHTDSATEMPAAPAAAEMQGDDPEEEEEDEEEELLRVLGRDEAAVRAAEGVLQKLHEGDPDPSRPCVYCNHAWAWFQNKLSMKHTHECVCVCVCVRVCVCVCV